MSSSSIHPPAPEGSGSDSETKQRLTRRRFTGLAGATLAAGLMPAAVAESASGRGGKPRHRPPRRPRLPGGFTRTFRSRFINANGLRQHAVIGGEGPPLLLVHGWPETWFAWRLVMPALARDFQVVAVDQRGIGQTAKPQSGYDTAMLANDLVALMDALGHQRFAVVGHDTGLLIGYALAADHPDRVARAAFAEVPGPPGAIPSPPYFIPPALNNKLWHIAFNQVDKLGEQLIAGREDIYFGYEFDIQAGEKKLSANVVDYYVGLVSSREALRGSLAFYREWFTMVGQNAERAKTALPMPVLAIGGAQSWGDAVGGAFTPLGNDVQGAVIAGAGHWIAEQDPAGTLAALTPFLAPYRNGAR